MGVRFKAVGRNRAGLLEQVRRRYEEYLGHNVWLDQAPDHALEPHTVLHVPQVLIVDVTPCVTAETGAVILWEATIDLPA